MTLSFDSHQPGGTRHAARYVLRRAFSAKRLATLPRLVPLSFVQKDIKCLIVLKLAILKLIILKSPIPTSQFITFLSLVTRFSLSK